MFKQTKYTYSVGNLDISKEEFLRFAKYIDVPSYISLQATLLYESLVDYNDIEGGFIIIPEIRKNNEDKTIAVCSQKLNVSEIIYEQIKKSEYLAIFICSAGHLISDLSQNAMLKGDTLSGYLYDMYGSFIVEKAMDKIQVHLEKICIKKGLSITNRFSPGYCNWNVCEQQILFSLFPENFTKVKLTESCLMLPLKSVSGIIGIGKNVKKTEYKCNKCNEKNCTLRTKQY